MVETRGASRRKSAPAAMAASNAPSTSGRQAGAAPDPAITGGEATAQQPVDYAQMYRKAAQQQKQEERSNIFRRLKGSVQLFYHQQAMIWGWYMLEPWETLLWMCILALISYFVLAACFANPASVCHSTLLAARKSLAAQGAKLFEFVR